ncbi:hypothetical protein [Streptomyces sp. WAC 05379]|uniref:hypothetical protein n=1 Tax=Streptomyces sp. WAC 05379 TaxID=2203207 RepID=UPI0037D9939D
MGPPADPQGGGDHDRRQPPHAQRRDPARPDPAHHRHGHRRHRRPRLLGGVGDQPDLHAGHRDSAQDGCVNAISDWLTVACSEAQGGDQVTVTATVDIPSIVPGWDFDPAQKTATMPLDH